MSVWFRCATAMSNALEGHLNSTRNRLHETKIQRRPVLKQTSLQTLGEFLLSLTNRLFKVLQILNLELHQSLFLTEFVYLYFAVMQHSAGPDAVSQEWQYALTFQIRMHYLLSSRLISLLSGTVLWPLSKNLRGLFPQLNTKMTQTMLMGSCHFRDLNNEEFYK